MVYIDVYIVFRVQSSSGIWLEPIHSIRRRCSLYRRSRALVQRPATWKEHNEVYVYFPIFHKEEKVYIVLLFPNMLNVVLCHLRSFSPPRRNISLVKIRPRYRRMLLPKILLITPTLSKQYTRTPISHLS